jgi:hypothetical protein
MFDDKGFATEDCAIRVFGVNENNEFAGSYVAQISIGTGLPAGAYPDEPPARRAGEAIIREGDKWVVVEDHRGETVYDMATRASSVVRVPGPVREGFTLLAPLTQFDKWIDGKWITDASEQSESITLNNIQQKAALILEASNYIAPLIDARDGGYIEDSDVPVLAAWQKYRYALTKVDPAKPVWPERPAS